MSYHRTLPATEPVRRYLLQMVAKSGSEPVRLLSERDLAEKLHLSRVTVRRAIEELEALRCIIRLPGRKGAFTNPEMASKVEHAVGIVVYRNYIGQLFSQFLSGISEELYSQGHPFCLSLFRGAGKTPAEQAFELENSGYDCVVWHTQTPEDLAVIDLLLRHDFPVLTICNPNYPEWGRPRRAWYGFDLEDAGDAVASRFLRCGCGKILYCSRNAEFLLPLRRGLSRRGVSLPDENVLLEEKDFFQRIPPLLTSGADGLFCRMNEASTTALLEFLAGMKNSRGLKIILPPRIFSERCRREYPQLDIEFPDTAYFQRQCIALGRRVAHGILAGKGPAEGVLLKSHRFRSAGEHDDSGVPDAGRGGGEL